MLIGGDIAKLDGFLERLYRVYEFFRDNEVDSGTSRMIRKAVAEGDFSGLVKRLNQETQELARATFGTEVHSEEKLWPVREVLEELKAGKDVDPNVVLEMNQVWYWSTSVAVAKGVPYREINAASFLQPEKRYLEMDPFQHAFEIASSTGDISTPAHFRRALTFIAATAHSVKLPLEAFALMDYRDMQKRPYYQLISHILNEGHKKAVARIKP